jgi:two-component system, LytTR family, sensor kinase
MQRKVLFFNIQFWSLYFLYEWLGNASVSCEYNRYLFNATAIVPLTFLAALFTVHVLIKRFYLKNKKQAFWALLLLSMIAFTLVRRTYNYYYTYPHYYPKGQIDTPYWFLPKLIIEAVNIYLIVALYALFHFIKAWYEQQRISQTLQQDKLQAELELLKSQVHPHFIFNTLNNIYSLAQQKNPRTPDLIYRLSSFLDYNLYNTKHSTIPVSKELEYIHHYIELEKIRFDSRLDVSVNVYDPLDGFYITPMLLLPLVENCFKHGMHSFTDAFWIRIDLSVQKDWLIIKIENSYAGDHPINGNGINGKGINGNGIGKGIGLDNVRRRLEIVYPGKHEFSCMSENQSYLVILKLKSYVHESKVPVGG